MPRNNEPKHETHLPTQKGNAGTPVVPMQSDALDESTHSKTREELDARQARIRERRKPGGPPKPESDAPRADAVEKVPDVPPTPSAGPES